MRELKGRFDRSKSCLEERTINVDLAHVIDDNGNLEAFAIPENFIEKGGFACKSTASQREVVRTRKGRKKELGSHRQMTG